MRCFRFFWYSFRRPASFRLSTLLGRNENAIETKKKSSSMSNLTEKMVGEGNIIEYKCRQFLKMRYADTASMQCFSTV